MVTHGFFGIAFHPEVSLHLSFQSTFTFSMSASIYLGSFAQCCRMGFLSLRDSVLQAR